MSATIKVTGVRQLEKKLKKIPFKLRQNVMRKGMRRFTALIRNRARELAPVRTKRLRKSIINKVSTRAKSGEIIGRVYVDPSRHGVHYGHLVEYGSKTNTAQRFMTRSFDEFAKTHPDLFNSLVAGAFEETMRKLNI